MSNRRKFPIPSGFTWNHGADAYINGAGDVWNDQTNAICDKHGHVITVIDATPTAAIETVEQEIVRKGLVAPRVTPEEVDAAIVKEEYITSSDNTLTVCVLTLKNGFTVTGESACASPANFDAALGRRIARDNAKLKIWPLLGYALREKLAAQGAMS